MTTSYVNLSKKSSSKRPRKSSMDVVEKKLNMSLDDIVEERKQHSQSPNGTSGKSRNTKRSDRIAQAGPYQRTTRGESGNDTVMGRRVYVGNLSYSVKSELLKDHMSAAGNVLHAMILESSTRFNHRSKGCGVVEYATEAEAARAIATLNDTEIDGRKIFVREDRESKSVGPMKSTGADENQVPNTTDGVTTTRVYVGNLSWSVKWQQLKDHMKTAGNIKHADVLVESNGRSKGCGLVEYETVEEAARAIEMLHDTELGGRKIFVREDREPEGGSIRSIAHRGTPTRPPFGRVPLGTNGSQTTLFVGNLPWDVTWQVLKEMFSSVGQVERTEIAQMPDGKSRGFGIVRFANPGDAARAIEQFNKMEMNGREIEVRYDKGRA